MGCVTGNALCPVIYWRNDTILFLLYLAVYGTLLIKAAMAEPQVILMGIPLVLLGIGMVYTLFTRIREIRSGEEDDLSNY